MMRVNYFGAAVVCSALTATAATAHPHVFIDAKAGFNFDAAGHLQGVRITWIYDAFSSLTLLDILDLDQDNDGVLTDADRAKIVTAQTIWPDDFEGDTYLDAAGKAIALGRPENGAAAMEDARIAVSFDLPLIDPLAELEQVELRLYDPLFYYAYTVLEAAPADACDVALTMFKPDETTSFLQLQLARLSREETPEQEDVGRLFSDVITLRCA